MKGLGIALFIVFGLSVLFVICAFGRIRIAIAIVKTASLFISDVKSVLLVPPFFILIFAIFWAFWISAAIFLYSIGDINPRDNIPVASVTWDDKTRKMVIYFIFAGLWANAFISAVNQFVIASACSIWYFAQSQAHMPVTKSFYRAFRYHLGSMAFGSFILAVVQFIQLILAYIEHYVTKFGGTENGLLKFILKCAQCYMACFERCVKFLNKNAYIQVALSGKNFCRSAWNAFSLIMRNPLKFGVVGGLGEVFIMIGKIMISASTTLICYLIITRVSKYSDDLNSPIFPTILFFVISYMIGAMFMSVYGLAILSILQCFLVDKELNKKRGRDPQYTPAPLRTFMDKYEKK